MMELMASEIIFLQRRTRILAVDNFRSFNIFLYFNFFYDCFMGILSAILRILFALFASVFMMPRISYSFVGRSLEGFDNGKQFINQIK